MNCISALGLLVGRLLSTVIIASRHVEKQENFSIFEELPPNMCVTTHTLDYNWYPSLKYSILNSVYMIEDILYTNYVYSREGAVSVKSHDWQYISIWNI